MHAWLSGSHRLADLNGLPPQGEHQVLPWCPASCARRAVVGWNPDNLSSPGPLCRRTVSVSSGPRRRCAARRTPRGNRPRGASRSRRKSGPDKGRRLRAENPGGKVTRGEQPTAGRGSDTDSTSIRLTAAPQSMRFPTACRPTLGPREEPVSSARRDLCGGRE